ncbi:nitroreductase/quinone reductase family protein [Ktedonosporobacter rubrisoli]|nr:nitroreductase/quinone reductase family protein [Ktedonosporobacter rubrisoli]
MPQTDQPLNQDVIKDFRENNGQISGTYPLSKPIKGIPLLLLHTKGAQSGLERVNPLAYLAEEKRLFVIASDAGGQKHPAWFRNALAHPQEVTVELGTETFAVRAKALEGEEREIFFQKMAAIFPVFLEYQQKAHPRLIPVVELIRQP